MVLTQETLSSETNYLVRGLNLTHSIAAYYKKMTQTNFKQETREKYDGIK